MASERKAFLSSASPASGARGRHRAVEVVEHRDEVAQQRLVGVLDVLLAVALAAAAEILDVGERAQEAVLLLVELTLQLLEARLLGDVTRAGLFHRSNYSSGVDRGRRHEGR